MKKLLFILHAVLTFTALAHADIYRCTGENFTAFLDFKESTGLAFSSVSYETRIFLALDDYPIVDERHPEGKYAYEANELAILLKKRKASFKIEALQQADNGKQFLGRATATVDNTSKSFDITCKFE